MANELRNSRFRYVDAADLAETNVDFDDLDVRNAAGDKLGEVDGFVVDAVSERPYYVVVNSGGWFFGGKYLVPVNHARLERDAKDNDDVLRVNLDKETIKEYPTFDKDEFARLSEDQLREFEGRIGQACCPDEAATVGTTWTYESWQHYRQPDWWTRVNRDRPIAVTRTEGGEQRRSTAARPGRPERERIVARDGQPAGHRAEPGDVLGIESGGEETHLGSTAEDERRRVRISDRETREAEKNNRG